MKSIRSIDVNKKTVLVRCDFNVSLTENDDVVDDLRIRQSLPTIIYLIEKGARVVLLSHFKEPSEKKDLKGKRTIKIDRSIFPILKRISFLLKKEVLFVDDCIGDKVKRKIQRMRDGDVLLLENVRAYNEEKENSVDFAREIASLADIFINDAFSVSHRGHASVAKVPLFIESATGFLFEKELTILKKVKNSPQKPVIAIIGGAKVESKIKAVDYFLKTADHLLLGGKIANMLLIVRGIAVNMVSPSREIVDIIKNVDHTSSKLHLPVDVIASKDVNGGSGVRATGPGKIEPGEDIYDIGEETINLYSNIIKNAGTVIWAGPLGLSEVVAFERGTRQVAKAVAKNSKAVKIVGGGDTLKAFKQFNLEKKIDLVSTGGGAMLTFLRGGDMPGIESLKAIKNEEF